jgi:hypothetical protein
MKPVKFTLQTAADAVGTKADNENRLFGIWAPAATAATGAI